MATLLLVSLLALLGPGSPQCISRNDNKFVSRTPDLRAITPFSVRLFKEVLPSSGNFFFSPFSIWTALALAYFGSRGNTETQLRQALQLRDKENALAMFKYLDGLYRSKGIDPSFTIASANRIYVDGDIPINGCLRPTLPNEMRIVNFRQPGPAASAINQFVRDTTRGRIPELVKPNDIAGAQMVLVNAIYFKGLWETEFAGRSTRMEAFSTSSRQSLQVNMMNVRSSFNTGYSKDLNARVIEIPYKGKTASMFVLLPEGENGKRDLHNMLMRLTPVTLLSAFQSLTRQEVNLAFPKMSLETTIQNQLLQALIRLGITDLFTSAADLTTFFPRGGERVSSGIHKAVLDVDEKGSEAAAATSLFVPLAASTAVNFRCNKPFAFFIYDKEVDNVLFMGVFRGP